MIATFMLHAVIVGAWCAAAAWAVEQGLAHGGAPRRMAWVLGMLASAVIPLAALVANGDAQTATASLSMSPVASARDLAPALFMSQVHLPAMPARPTLERVLALCWSGLSFTALLVYVAASWRLARRARGWSRYSPTRDDVLLADDIGPAVFGLLRPRVVLPRWLGTASGTTQDLVLAHERQHVAARDPQLLALALALVALMPWNLPLLWQLRRLRFALEVDCDTRVLNTDTDPAEYGEALLFVSQRDAPAPAGAIALVERASQLERRIEIMTAAAHRFRKSIALAAVVLGAACLFMATSITAPALAAIDAPLKPTPSGGTALKIGRHFEQVLAERFPGLLEQDHDGTAMVVMLLNDDWSVASAAQVTTRDAVPVDERIFGVLGISREDVPYVGNMGMQSPLNPAHKVLMVYTERSTPGKRFVSHVFPDNRAVDREIFRRHFPHAAKNGVPGGLQPWVLLDREGHVLRSGQENVEPSEWNRTLESRFPGIKTEGITVTPITDDSGEPVLDGAGKELQLNSVWLAPGSPAPKS
jgi:beta-lactamase regulating signal transducer with metallopeptidase domain